MDALSDTPSRHPSVVWVEVDDQAVLYHAGRRTMHVLDPVGSWLWARLDGETTMDELVTELAAAGRDAGGGAREYVLVLVRALTAQGLLASESSGPSESSSDGDPPVS